MVKIWTNSLGIINSSREPDFISTAITSSLLNLSWVQFCYVLFCFIRDKQRKLKQEIFLFWGFKHLLRITAGDRANAIYPLLSHHFLFNTTVWLLIKVNFSRPTIIMLQACTQYYSSWCL